MSQATSIMEFIHARAYPACSQLCLPTFEVFSGFCRICIFEQFFISSILTSFCLLKLLKDSLEVQNNSLRKDFVCRTLIGRYCAAFCSEGSASISVKMLKIPQHQVAGHEAGNGKLGPLVDESGRFYKPLQGDERGANEVAFYSSFSTNSKIPEHIQRFFPSFYGTQLIEASDGSGMRPYLILGDLAQGRANPSIMDIKIGSRTWAPEASEKYIEKCLKKDRESSSLPLGFRISGLQIYRSKELGFLKHKKKGIQKLPAEEVKLVLKKFVSNLSDLDLNPDSAFASTVYGGSTGILAQLLELKAWFEDQTIYHFYACSILIVFEKELALEGQNPAAQIKLIDFAHVYEGKGVIDHNFLGGLCSLIKFISEILTTPNECTTEVSTKTDQKDLTNSCNGADQKKLANSDSGADQKNLANSVSGAAADQMNLTN